MLTSGPSAGELERAEVAKMNAETDKLNAETQKILTETRWYPIAALSAVVVAGVGGIAAIVVTAIKVMLAH